MFKKRSKFVGITLILFWLIASIAYAYQKEISFSLLVVPQRTNIYLTKEIASQPQKYLVKGSFTADHNNLGILFLKSLVNKNLRKENTFIFKLKQEGRTQWDYVSIRRLSPSLTYFPYGFPIIKNSKNKKFTFEVRTDSQEYIHAVQSNILKPAVQLGYQYPKAEILESGKSLLLFTLMKLSSWAQDADLFFVSVLLALPALYFYLGKGAKNLYHKLLKKILTSKSAYPFSKDLKDLARMLRTAKGSEPIMLFAFMLGISILLLEEINNLVIMLILGIWIFMTMRLGLTSKNTLMLGMTLLILTIMAVAFGWTSIAIKATVWLFAFLTVGVVQGMWEIRNNDHEKK